MAEQELDDVPVYVLRLYVTGRSPRAQRAIDALKALCESRLAGRYDLRVINIVDDPDAADDAQILATPTVIKFFPGAEKRVIGDLTDEKRVVDGLELPSFEEQEHP